MKLVSLMAGAAAVALIATTASAQVATETSYVNTATGANTGLNVGMNVEKSATFSVSGSVAASCILGNGDSALSNVSFNQLGIYGDISNGVDNAFEMIGARNGNTSTNAAGCNTSNRVTITKTGGAAGLSNAGAAAAGYDPAVFQANIPYELAALYTAGNVGQVGVSGSLGKFTVDTTEATDSRENGAWRSDFSIKVVIPAPTKALVAGNYTDTVAVTIQAL